MKIVLATGIYPPEIGGPAGYVKGVATDLAEQGHEVYIVTYGDNPEPSDRYQIVNIKKGDNVVVRYLKYAYQTWKLAKNADIIFAQGPVSEGVPAAVASLLSGKPFLMKIVGDFAWEQYMQSDKAVTDPESLDEFLRSKHQGKIRLYEIAERWSAKRAKRIVVATKYMRESIAKWGIDKEKIKVIYNSIEFKPLDLDGNSRQILNLPTDKKIIITAGRIIYWKRLDIIIRCLSKLNDEWIFVVAGDGPMLETWKKLAVELGVDQKILWLGRIDRSLLARYIKTSDLFVIPSSLETFSFVLLEAVQQGCPCVISDRGGMVEVGGMFKDLVKIAPFENIDKWVEGIKEQALKPHQIPQWPDFFSQSFMVKETYELLSDIAKDVAGVKDCNKVKDANDSDNAQKRVLSIGLEKKLFEDGKVRDRIVEQLKDFDATIIVFAKRKFDEQIAPNVRVISTNSWNKFVYVTDALRIVWKLRKQKFDVITSQDPTETGLVAYLASKFLKTALAIQDHGYHFHSHYYRKESWLNQFRYLFARFAVTRADAVRVVSQRTEDALKQLGIHADKIIKFPLTLDGKFLASNSSNSSVNSEQWAVTGDTEESAKYKMLDTRYFLLVCRFVPIKRIDLAIHAFSILAKQNPDVKLKIVGQGPLESQIKQWIADFDLQSRAEIIPWTDNLADLYRGAISTLITSDREGFGMTAVESLACGTPVIMSDVGCAGEIVKNGENGIIVPVGDVMAIANAMEKLLQLPITPLRSSNFEGRANYQLPMQEAFGINQNIQNGTKVLGNESKFQVPRLPTDASTEVLTKEGASAKEGSKFASEASMTDFLLSAIRHQLSAKKKEDEEFWRFSEKSNKEGVRDIKKPRLMLYTPSLDHKDPVFGFSVRWADEFARQTEKLTIISRFVDQDDVPVGAKGIALGKPWVQRIFKLWYTSIKYRNDYDKVFLHMAPETAIAGWPVWFLLRKPIYLWYAHGAVPPALKIAEPLVKLIFASSETGLRLKTPKARFVGQGIDTELFKPDPEIKKENIIITISRITPKKKYEDTLDFLAGYKEKYPEDNWQYHIIGPSLGCEDYIKNLKDKAELLEIGERFKVVPAVEYVDLPTIYNKTKLFLSTSQTGSIDKVVLEALACGIPVIARGEGYQKIYGVTNLLDQKLAFDKLHSSLTSSKIDFEASKEVEKSHGLKRLVSVILGYIST